MDAPGDRADHPPDEDVASQVYVALMDTRRRLALLAVGLTVAFGLVALVYTVQWSQANAAAEAVEDVPLVEALGFEIPDPRPALERAEWRSRAVVRGVVAIVTGTVAVVAAAFWFAIRPMAPPSRPTRPLTPRQRPPRGDGPPA